MVWPSSPVIAYRTYRVRASALAHARRRLFGIDAAEASFASGGSVPAEPARQQRLEQIGGTFVAGYNAAVRTRRSGRDRRRSGARSPDESSGFAFEGAAMGFALLDLVSPWRSRRFARFLAGVAGPHVYMAHVGAGWALARTSPKLVWRLGKLDPLLRWLMFDGYGFHAGYFHHARIDRPAAPPQRAAGIRAQCVRPGIGPRPMVRQGRRRRRRRRRRVEIFPKQRRADLWSGIGLGRRLCRRRRR